MTDDDFPSNRFFKKWFIFVGAVAVAALSAGIFFGYGLLEWIKTK